MHDQKIFEVKYFCSWWGLDHLGTAAMLQKIKQGGFDGVEIAIPDKARDRSELKSMLTDLELDVIAHQYLADGADPKAYLGQFTYWIEAAASFQPLFINSHTAKDHWTMQDVAPAIIKGNELGQQYGIKVLHETHRGRFLYGAPVARQYFEAFPELRITADFSHWTCVAESLLEDQQETLAMAIGRADHIHARVGHAEGPQVSDPRAPEWQNELNTFLSWWQKITDRIKSEGGDVLTITPEFGPSPYMWNQPYTGQPLADQWELNCFMKDHLKGSLKY